ncbi:HAEPLYID family protein [Limibacter armeniacum]|uniref:HAEPLYID family protein n=1 Tax=Limibacter armeniacum TaxID=466084 RepID=UPI002FE5B90B
MKFINMLVLIMSLALYSHTFAQTETENSLKDSLYIQEVESDKQPIKVLHAEPLYIDLIRDLGARKGEKEWNVGIGMTDKLSHDSYEALIEYEFAPIDRLGLEVELPFTFHSPIGNASEDTILANKIESLKIATQWTFFVNERMATSMAIGYINEFVLSDFKQFGSPVLTGNVYNPFLIVAKRWGNNFHSLIYTGPVIEQDFESKEYHSTYDINTSFHYMIPGTRNFIGVEFNQTVDTGVLETTIRPQMRVGITDNLMIGIVGGIPINRENERLSSFVRLIYEPRHHKKN